jgi:hypothetical protein
MMPPLTESQKLLKLRNDAFLKGKVIILAPSIAARATLVEQIHKWRGAVTEGVCFADVLGFECCAVAFVVAHAGDDFICEGVLLAREEGSSAGALDIRD